MKLKYFWLYGSIVNKKSQLNLFYWLGKDWLVNWCYLKSDTFSCF